MLLQRISVPLGVVAMVYEARPNVTADAAGICLKAGNACVLRGGSQALHSNIALTKVLRDAAQKAGLPADSICSIETADRAATDVLMGLHGLVDVLIPRGGAGLIRHCIEHSKVPVIETGTGNCHVYVHESADFDIARAIVMNAKTQRTGVCNACESLLVDEAAAKAFLPRMLSELANAGVVVHGDSLARECAAFAEEGGSANVLEHFVDAVEADWGTEYLALEISVKTVGSVEEAIEHINRYGTGHSRVHHCKHVFRSREKRRGRLRGGRRCCCCIRERFHALHRRGMLRARCRNRHLYPEAACARPLCTRGPYFVQVRRARRGAGARLTCAKCRNRSGGKIRPVRWYAGVLTIWVAKMPTGHFALESWGARSTLFISGVSVRRAGARRVRARWRRLHACRR